MRRSLKLVTNFAAGLCRRRSGNHAETKEMANEGSARFKKLLREFIKAHDASAAAAA